MMRHLWLGVCSGGVVAVCVSAALAAPDTWDPRLTDLGICYFEANVTSGTWYWKLISGVYEDETQSGGTVCIYYKCLNSSGQPIADQWTWAGRGNTGSSVPCPVIPNPMDATVSQQTKGAIDGYWGNYPMAGGWCPFWPSGPHGGYGAWVDGPSDQVWGMGLPCNRHVNYRYVWQWTQAGPPPQPTIARSPTGFSHTISQGQSLAGDTFTVWNSGGGTLAYSITDNVTGAGDWLSETPVSGTATTETDTIAVHYSTSGLAQGTYPATITISDPNSTNKTATIAVSLTVGPPVVPGDFDGDGDVDQQDFGRFQACYSGDGYEQTDPACAKAKLDGDYDVDQLDFAIFAGCMSGPGVQGAPNCAQGG
jgi:hypothetical protein